MDAGCLAGNAEGKVVSIWMRKKEIFLCEPGKPEVSMGRGEQGWAAAGPDGFYFVWIGSRPGVLMALPPGSHQPIQLADTAIDPVVAASPNGKGPVIAAWEEGDRESRRIHAAVLRR